MAARKSRGRGVYGQDLTGRRFGRLTVTGEAERYYSPSGKSMQRRWHCVCDCGRKTTVISVSLVHGHTKSCGCLKQEVSGAHRRTHGMYRTRVHRVWNGIRQRCHNPAATAYESYGGAGIKVCEGWHTFENFYADMGDPPLGTSIDRIDNDGGYWCGHCAECVANGRPANCRWADVYTQARNTRRQRRIVFEGRDLHVEEWAEMTGIHHEVIWQRIHRRKWDVGRALSEPVNDWYSHGGPQKNPRPILYPRGGRRCLRKGVKRDH